MTGSPQLLLLEVNVIERFRDFHLGDVHFGVCGNDKLLMSPAQGDSVQDEGA